MKPGGIYKARLCDADNAHPHWYVVVLYIKSNKACIAIPAYSEGGAGVNAFLERDKSAGFPEHAAGVLLDNSVSIDLEPHVKAHRAWWMTAQFQWASADDFSGSEFIGQMKVEPLKELVRSLLARSKHRESKGKSALIAQEVKVALEDFLKAK